MMEEKDKEVGSRNIEEIRKIFNDIIQIHYFKEHILKKKLKIYLEQIIRAFMTLLQFS